MGETSDDSGDEVSGILFPRIYLLLRTQNRTTSRSPGTLRMRSGSRPPLGYGVATTREACSADNTRQARLRCSPRIAPVTLRILPGQDSSRTKATSYGASTSGSDLRMVCAEHGRAIADKTRIAAEIRMFVTHPPAAP